MERAIGGAHLFPSQSPALILANALGRQRRQGLLQAQHASWEALQANPAELLEEAGEAPLLPPIQQPLQQPEQQPEQQPAVPAEGASVAAAPAPQLQLAKQREQQQPPVAAVAAGPYYQSFQLQGEAIARRINFDRVAAAAAVPVTAAAAAAAAPVAAAAPAAGSNGGWDGSSDGDAASSDSTVASGSSNAAVASGDTAVASGGIMDLTVEAALRLPPTVLSSSCTDITVPW
jgi:hypothetical protein